MYLRILFFVENKFYNVLTTLTIWYIMPLEVRRMTPNEQTKAALAEYDEMKDKTGKYKRYSAFDELIDEVQNDT